MQVRNKVVTSLRHHEDAGVAHVRINRTSHIGEASVPSADSSSQGIQDFTDKLKQLWSNSQRNLVLSAVLAAIVAAIIVVALWSSTQSYRPLYSQQERFDTGEIVSVLESEGINYRLQEQNGQVLVPEGEVTRIRMC